MNKERIRERYELYLQSDHWQSLRKLAFSAHGHNCENCKSSKNIHVHHIQHRNLTDVSTEDLVVLCQDCHNIIHHFINKHPNSLVSREKVIQWFDQRNKRFIGIRKAGRNQIVKLNDKQLRKRHLKLQRKIKKMLYKPIHPKASSRKFLSFSEGTYSQKTEMEHIISNAVGIKLIPAVENKTQVSA